MIISRSHRDLWQDVPDSPAGGIPVAIGGALTVDVLLSAYRRGFLCQPLGDVEDVETYRELYEADVDSGSIAVLPGRTNPYEVFWWSPDTRYALIPSSLHLGRSAIRSIRRNSWETSVNEDVAGVLASCRTGRTSTWLTDELLAVLLELHGLGVLHSAEVWEAGKLVGGTFGCSLGAVFSMDSAFHRRSDAGKVAIGALARRLPQHVELLDAQVKSDYIVRMGALPLSREEYLGRLSTATAIGPRLGREPAVALLHKGW